MFDYGINFLNCQFLMSKTCIMITKIYNYYLKSA